MKIIDLLNEIANGEEVPKYIKYYDKFHSKEDIMLCCYANLIYKLDNDIVDLTDEVEILDNEDKEEKGLPEKLEGIDSLFVIGQDLDLKSFLAWQKANNKIIENKVNKIIDYLEKQSKGE